jgi:DegV family protein with EDD domain
MRVAVVTDSTAYLPAGIAAQRGVTVVPLHVVLGGRTGAENVEVSPAEVASALGERRITGSTSRPTPGEFAEACRASGATQVASLHLSSALSGTVDSARLGAAQVLAEGIEVRVVDTKTIAMGLGFAVLAAAETAASEGDLVAVEADGIAAAAATTTLFYVDSLEHLRRGGRMTARAALVGTALAVKPLLHVANGEIELLEKVRTASKGLARLEQLAVQRAGDGPVDLAVHHLAAADSTELLADRLRGRLPGAGDVYLSEVGAVVGAHVGPGLLGVVVLRR